jgi:hypothetical protein
MYKIVQDNKIIDVIKYPKFIKFLATGHIAMTGRSTAEGVVGSDNEALYCFLPIKGRSLPVVQIAEINETEFSRLVNLLNSGQAIYADESALVKAKRVKLEALSIICKNKIVAGFSIALSDGQQSFKLTTEDQLNLMQIEAQLSSGESYFVYHATNQPCRLYNREDMAKIISAFRKHVLYHTTYYNSVKQYINSLSDLEKINMFSYGDDISDSVTDPVLRQIVKNGGNLQ